MISPDINQKSQRTLFQTHFLHTESVKAAHIQRMRFATGKNRDREIFVVSVSLFLILLSLLLFLPQT